MGDPMLELARYDRIVIALRIPEQAILQAQDCRGATFAPSARPQQRLALGDLRVPPSTTVIDGRNVFVTEAVALATLEGLAPGMEGVVHLDVGYRPVWWVLTHRLTDWLAVNFWV